MWHTTPMCKKDWIGQGQVLVQPPPAALNQSPLSVPGNLDGCTVIRGSSKFEDVNYFWVIITHQFSVVIVALCCKLRRASAVLWRILFGDLLKSPDIQIRHNHTWHLFYKDKKITWKESMCPFLPWLFIYFIFFGVKMQEKSKSSPQVSSLWAAGLGQVSSPGAANRVLNLSCKFQPSFKSLSYKSEPSLKSLSCKSKSNLASVSCKSESSLKYLCSKSKPSLRSLNCKSTSHLKSLNCKSESKFMPLSYKSESNLKVLSSKSESSLKSLSWSPRVAKVQI